MSELAKVIIVSGGVALVVNVAIQWWIWRVDPFGAHDYK